MELENFNNKVVKITGTDNQTYEGICLFNDKEVYDEEYDSLSIKTGNRWIRLFKNKIVTVEIINQD
jgi:hypothetical protein